MQFLTVELVIFSSPFTAMPAPFATARSSKSANFSRWFWTVCCVVAVACLCPFLRSARRRSCARCSSAAGRGSASTYPSILRRAWPNARRHFFAFTRSGDHTPRAKSLCQCRRRQRVAPQTRIFIIRPRLRLHLCRLRPCWVDRRCKSQPHTRPCGVPTLGSRTITARGLLPHPLLVQCLTLLLVLMAVRSVPRPPSSRVCSLQARACCRAVLPP